MMDNRNIRIRLRNNINIRRRNINSLNDIMSVIDDKGNWHNNSGFVHLVCTSISLTQRYVMKDEDDGIAKKYMKLSSDSNDVPLDDTLSKYGVDLKRLTFTKIINLCKMRQ